MSGGTDPAGKVNPVYTDLSLNTPWAPTGGLRRRRDRCNEPPPPPPLRSPRGAGEAEARALRTRSGPLEEVVEAGQGCL